MKKRMMTLTAILLCGVMLAACSGNRKTDDAASVSASAAETSSEEKADAEDSDSEESEEESEDADEKGSNSVEEENTEEDLVRAESAEAAAEGTEETEKTSEDTADTEESESGSSDAASAMVREAQEDPLMAVPTIDGEYSPEECIKLGDYKNLKLDMEIQEVTDEDIDTYLTYLVQPVEVEDEKAVLEEGDTANLDFTGYLDGEEFSGGSSTGYDLEIGSGTFIPGFEEQMIGMKKGEERDLELTFPETYASEELAGQDVVFHVKLNAVKRMPEIDDEWAETYSDGEYKTLEEFREATREDLEEQNRSYAETSLQNEAWSAVLEDSEILAFPEELLQEKREEYSSYLESEAQIYGMTGAEYIEQMGMTMEDFDQINEVQVRSEVQNGLLLDALVEAEKITEDDSDYKEELERLTETYSMTEDELKETYGEDVLYNHLKSIVAINRVLSYADITEKLVSE